jgi:hypothetical protein
MYALAVIGIPAVILLIVGLFVLGVKFLCWCAAGMAKEREEDLIRQYRIFHPDKRSVRMPLKRITPPS